MGYNIKKGYVLERNATKRTYYESLNMDVDLGSKIRHIIQESNENRIKQVKKYIKNIYRNNGVGGALHICLDDENLNDNDIIWCLENSIEDIQDYYWKSQYYNCAKLLLELSYSKRLKVVRNTINEITKKDIKQMYSINEMFNKILELKRSEKDKIWFDVDESNQIFVEIFSYQNGELKIAIEWRDIDTNETYESTICDYDNNYEIKNALEYIRRCALDSTSN